MRNPIPSSRLTRWILRLREFDIQVILPTAKKSQALAEILATFPTTGEDAANKKLLGESQDMAFVEEEQEWKSLFDEATPTGSG